MVEITAQVREWGRSIGVVIPKEAASKAHLNAGYRIRLLIMKNKNPLKETFGILKFKRSTEENLREVDKEAWNE